MPLFGPKWPLAPGNHDTFELIQDLKEQINFYLRCLLLTSPGENISDPNYGVGLRRLLFEPNVGSGFGSLQSKISSQISKYLPFIITEDIIVGSTDQQKDENKLSIQIVYFIPGDVTQRIFKLDLQQDNIIGFY